MSANATFAELGSALREHRRFVVMSHLRPDGDALGCTLAMTLCLQAMGKEVSAWNQDSSPEKFRFLPGSELLRTPPSAPEDFEVAVILDTAVRERIGTCEAALGRVGLTLNLDHHISNNHYGDLAYIDSAAPAAGQILAEFFRAEALPLTRGMAENLYVAISTDTGSFQYPNTTAATYRVAAELIDLGVPVGALSQKMYESYPRRRIELLRSVLNELRFSAGDRVASISLSLATVARLGVRSEDNEGLIDYIRAVQGVVAAAFFEELPEGQVRISLRSKDARVNVAKVCALFGGGGHILAAGARAAGSLAEVEGRVLAAIAEVVATLPAEA